MLETVLLETIEFDSRAYLKTVDRVLGQAVRESARDWLRYIIPEVPVETGMAKGALRPIGQLLRVAVPISGSRRPYYSHLEGTTQEPSAGASMSSFILKTAGFDYEFEWTTEVLHYWIEDFYNGFATPGEHVLEAAVDVFLDALEERITNRLPNYASFITVKQAI